MFKPCVRACILPLDCTCAAGEYAAELEAAVVLLPVAFSLGQAADVIVCVKIEIADPSSLLLKNSDGGVL